MFLNKNRCVGIAVSTVLLSLISSAANAQIDVLTGQAHAGQNVGGTLSSTYTFSSSMILNSVGFYTRGNLSTYLTLSYSIDGVNQSFERSNLVQGVDGISWLTLSNPVTILKDQVVVVTTKGRDISQSFNDVPTFLTDFQIFASVNPNAPVSYNTSITQSFSNHSRFSNSNLRVSNPVSNVAPEPGTFALALTGGGALIGICIRRRRNAA
jgi:hypothetical protein